MSRQPPSRAPRPWAAAVLGALWLCAMTFAPVTATAAATTGAAPNLFDFTCVLPSLPRGVPVDSGRTQRLAGPAVTALTGGAARHGFSLDGGDLVVQPPRRGDVPLLSAHQALCGAMASTEQPGAYAAQGVAVGYGRVSVAHKFFPALTSFPDPGIDAAQNPTVASFTDRLAWLVVVRAPSGSFSCPASTGPVVRLVPRAGDHGYEVFMIDARTGTDALVYYEGGPGGCTPGARVPPHVGVAEESLSVPWTLVSRDPDGYAGTIAATVLPCDKTPNTVLVDQAGPNVVVEVTEPFGPPCGTPETVTLSLDAAVVTADLPAVIGHDPVGLVEGVALPPPPGAPSTTTTTTAPAALVPVDASMNGQTLDVEVGQVVTLDPLPGSELDSLTSPAVSTNPAVLGPLTSNPQPLVAEFRAWKQGTAEITVPQSACVQPNADQLPCSGSFEVTVDVR